MSWENPESDEPSTLSPADHTKTKIPSINPEQSRVQPVEDHIESALAEHPEVAAVIARLTTDKTDHLDLTRAIRDPSKAKDALATLAELADGNLLRGRTFDEYARSNPGQGPLFEALMPGINTTADDRNRKNVFIDRCKEADPVLFIGRNPDDNEQGLIDGYARRLRNFVEPAVHDELSALASFFDGASLSIRTKIGTDIIDKVERRASGSDSRPARPGYQVGDVIDAVGARITVADMYELGNLLQAAKEHFGVGDNGRILEIENMYAAPKPDNNDYRVVPLCISTKVDGQPYTYELQLTTWRASIAADLCHNTIYKLCVRTSDVERAKIVQMSAEAAALDQEETRRAP